MAPPVPQARLGVAQEKQAESEGGRQQALKAVQEAWKQIDDLRAQVRRLFCLSVPCHDIKCAHRHMQCSGCS